MPSPNLRRFLRVGHVAGLLISFQQTDQKWPDATPWIVKVTRCARLPRGPRMIYRFFRSLGHRLRALTTRANPTRAEYDIRRIFDGTWRICALSRSTASEAHNLRVLRWFRAGLPSPRKSTNPVQRTRETALAYSHGCPPWARRRREGSG